MKLKLLAAIAIASMSLGACATVTRGTNTAWEVQTTPDGARVETSNGHLCPSTPCAMKMPRKSEFTATISKPGYKTTTVSVTNKISTAGGVGMAGNVLVGGIIGIGVDATSGAMLDLTPNPAVVTLEPETTADAAPAPVAAAPAAEAATATQAAAPAGDATVAAPASPGGGELLQD